MRITRTLVSAMAFVLLHAGSLSGQERDAQGEGTALRIDRVFESWARPAGPGGAMGVIEAGRLVHARGFGLANLEHAIPNSPQTVFRIGSTSKQFTAACVLILAHQKKMNLDDALGRHWKDLDPALARVTVWQLLHHTSGISDYLSLHTLAGYRDSDWYTPAESIGLVLRQKKLMFAPGTTYSYSNSNYLLLGELVSRVSGQSLRAFAQQEIFGPLGMTSTHFHDDHSQVVKGRAHGYARGKEGWRISNTTLDHVGDGGIFTTVEDLARWDRVFYDNPLAGGRELAATLLETAHGSGTYACGIGVRRYRGLQMHAHGGAFVGFRAEMIRFPTEKVSIICLANFGHASPSRRARQVAEIVLGDKLGKPEKPAGRPPRSVPAAASRPAAQGSLSAYAGTFTNSELPAVYLVSVKGDRLELSCGPRSLKAVRRGADVFTVGSHMELEFRRDEEGAVCALSVRLPRTVEMIFLRAGPGRQVSGAPRRAPDD